ncbi:hypothetical protein SARC_05072 [Sphaeroforma arctica JP610]|uniref:Uncharacterized protein n=1 Tax=Sphaeroforma arctica JP610 TaxID=667725 RepID=A0A0L0G1G7_9EUKA|nr:hypothetical protein SARC_05072 [Sphaeroforma arctica JP610]KNC82651.1 hypothetical protein SARC_05072 [Sphaeroforma arctica JP610]|eukprot:XP_014156553.1 hypothetical protein SARC_05072 [Sphaeroforma arctica JP610]
MTPCRHWFTTLKLRRKILEAESAPSKTANQKLQRMQDTYADYQKQLEIAGIDFAAEAEQEDKAQAQQEKLKNLEAEFSDAWREHNGLARREAPANECGCQKEARLEREAEETAKAKVDKSQFSMRERIEYKIASLEAKVEEQRFRLQWFGDQGIDVDAKTVVADKAEVVKDEL